MLFVISHLNWRSIGRLLLSAIMAIPAAAKAGDDIVVRGILPERTEAVAGSISVVEPEQLQRSQPLSTKEALRHIAGLQIIDEDVLGLKLNISVRGLTPRRSARTLLLEDGAPIQPAPYADPSAHHATPIDRVNRIEFRKGSAQVLFGPQSIGGVINFVTTPVPQETEIGGRLTIGERNYRNLFTSLGSGNAKSGIRLELLNAFASGTRDFHDSEVSEAVIKGGIVLGDHRLTAKVSHYLERSAVTESGLTQARFGINPYANPFRSDYFRLDRTAAQLVHDWQITNNAQLSTQIYWADTFRASYRQTDTSVDSMTANPATGCVGAARTDYEGFADRCGNKMRPRRFRFWGIEPRLIVNYAVLGVPVESILGVRAHSEDTNRKRYNGLTPDAREASPGTVLRDDNDIDTRAFAAYYQSIVTVGELRLSPGLRIERTQTTNRARMANFVSLDRTARATQSVLLPGFGVTWSPSTALTGFIGVHRGFAPPRPDRDIDPNAPFNAVRPERSVETEAGFRARPIGGVSVDVTLYNMELDDLIIEGPLVGGRSGSFVNAGTARHRGLELSGQLDHAGWRLVASYNLLAEAKFTSDAGEGAAGVRGNRIPYAPRHLLSAMLGYDFSERVNLEFGLNHVSSQFADARNTRAPSDDGRLGLIPAHSIFRMAGSWALPASPYRIGIAVENLFNHRYIASRTDGLFAGGRRQITIGLRRSF
jgi:Fe(3+) dicitrate transport protein